MMMGPGTRRRQAVRKLSFPWDPILFEAFVECITSTTPATMPEGKKGSKMPLPHEPVPKSRWRYRFEGRTTPSLEILTAQGLG